MGLYQNCGKGSWKSTCIKHSKSIPIRKSAEEFPELNIQHSAEKLSNMPHFNFTSPDKLVHRLLVNQTKTWRPEKLLL